MATTLAVNTCSGYGLTHCVKYAKAAIDIDFQSRR